MRMVSRCSCGSGNIVKSTNVDVVGYRTIPRIGERDEEILGQRNRCDR